MGLLDALKQAYQVGRNPGEGVGLKGLTSPGDPTAPYQAMASLAGMGTRYVVDDPLEALKALAGAWEKAVSGQGYDPVQEVTYPLMEFGMTSAVGSRVPGLKPPKGSLGAFVGADPDMVVAAKKRLGEGATPEDVWHEMMVMQGPEGKWRTEIPDKDVPLQINKLLHKKREMAQKLHAKYFDAGWTKHYLDKGFSPEEALQKVGQATGRNLGEEALDLARSAPAADLMRWAADYHNMGKTLVGDPLRLRDVYPHHDLFAKYPNLEDMPFEVGSAERMGSSTRGRVTGGPNKMVQLNESIAPMMIQGKKTTAHEVSHLIDAEEGWAQGGSPEMFSNVGPAMANDNITGRDRLREGLSRIKKNDPEVRALFNENYERWKAEDFVGANEALNQAHKLAEWKAYRNLASEIQARDAGNRAFMSEQELREKIPELLRRRDDPDVITWMGKGHDHSKSVGKPKRAYGLRGQVAPPLPPGVISQEEAQRKLQAMPFSVL